MVCGNASGLYSCDREPGHGGSHRGYNEEHDAPMFWEDVKPAEELLERIRAVLRAFYSAELSASSVQPVLDLAAELNPDLQPEKVCSWCKAVMREGPQPTTYGICAGCQDTAFSRR